jgi:L-alanine-DL-glutamate epimerase-like enolase superfamily enzyme
LRGAKVGFGKASNAHLGFERARDVDFVEKVIVATGAGNSLMVDLGVKHCRDIATAIHRACTFDELGIARREEPLGHDDPEGDRALWTASGIRIAKREQQ